MQLPNREKLEMGMAARLSRMAAFQRRRFAEVVLWLPQAQHFALPPESFWRDIEQESQREFDVELAIVFLAAAQYHAFVGLGGEPTERAAAAGFVRAASSDGQALSTDQGISIRTLPGRLREQSKEYADIRSRESAKLFADSTRRAADALDKRVQELLSQDAPVTTADIERELAKFVTPEAIADQAAAFAIDETTAAQSAGGDAGIDLTVGLDPYDLWITRPDKSSTGPCKICQPLHRKPRVDWQQRYPLGPGPWVHPRCVCEVVYANVRKLTGKL